MSDQGRQRDFEASYHGDGPPPWDIGRPQPAFEAVADEFRGLVLDAGCGTGEHVLDAGCGTGEHALLAASRGLDAVGVDAAPTAIARAEEKARERGLAARFLVADALALGDLGERFDTVLDCGLFHVFDDDDRPRYVRSLGDAVAADGRVFLLCFSDRQPGDWGPRRVTEDELRASFADGWRIDAIDAVGLDVTIQPEPVEAWRARITRLPAS